MTAGRLFAEGRGELLGIHIALALSREGAQDFGGRGRKTVAPQRSRSAGVDGDGGTSPAACSPFSVGIARPLFSST
jgi:hypothetical protein